MEIAGRVTVTPKLTPYQKAEAVKRRDSEALLSIGHSYNGSPQTISRLVA